MNWGRREAAECLGRNQLEPELFAPLLHVAPTRDWKPAKERKWAQHIYVTNILCKPFQHTHKYIGDTKQELCEGIVLNFGNKTDLRGKIIGK